MSLSVMLSLSLLHYVYVYTETMPSTNSHYVESLSPCKYGRTTICQLSYQTGQKVIIYAIFY